MSARVAWLLVALTAAFAVARVAILGMSGRLWTTEAVSAGFPLVDLGAVTGAIIGALIISRHPRHPIGWLFVVGQSLTQVGVAAGAYGVAAVRGDLGDLPAGPLAIWLGLQVGAFPTLALLALLFLLAPDGRRPRGRWALGMWASLAGLALHTVALIGVRTDRVDATGQVDASAAGDLRQALFLAAYALIAAGVVTGAAAVMWRLRHSDGVTREQLTWISLAAVVLACAAVFTVVAVEWLRLPAWFAVLPLMVAYAAVPVLTGIGILRHRLFGVDVVLNRAILLALLSGGATVLYVAAVVVVSGPGPQSMTDLGLLPSLVLTTVVAVVLQPLRSRASRFATRLVYGAQATPYVALADFTRDLQKVPHLRDMLTTVAEGIGRTVGASQVHLRIDSADHPDWRPTEVAWHDTSARHTGDGEHGADWVAPVHAGRGDPVGEVAVTMPPGRGLRSLERQLLADFVTQIGHAVATVRLGAELAARATELAALTRQLDASRRRLQAARAEERRRFEAAIRHVVLPHLEPLPAQLRRLAASLVAPGREQAAGPGHAEDVAVVMARTNQAVEALRTVTRGVFPAQLARRGFAPALQTHVTGAHPGVPVTVDEDWHGRRLDPRLESTLYFSAVDLLEKLRTVRRVELPPLCADRVRVLVVGSPPTTGFSGQMRVLGDRLSVFDGALRIDRDGGDDWTFRIELPATLPASAEQASPGGAQAVRVE